MPVRRLLLLSMSSRSLLNTSGADYAFLSEIPMFTPYEVRAKVAGWDEKWVSVVKVIMEEVTH